MKILISSDGIHAHYFQRMSWMNAFRACGFTVGLWDCKSVPAFDVFDQFEPDIFLGQSYNLDESLIKCIYERPHLKVGLRSCDWGDHQENVDKQKYRILFCSNKEKHILKKLKEETGKPDFVHIHYDEEAIKCTHNHFSSIGIDVKSLMMCADTFMYFDSSVKEDLVCDIGFVGGYWPYKGLVIDKYLMPLLSDIYDLNVKIFGNQPWPSANQYCGLISDENVKNLFASAKICPNLSEPHAQEFGIDVNERIFKVLCAGGFCVSDYVKSYEMFEDGVVLCKTPEDFREKIYHYINNAEERSKIANIGKSIVMKRHTGFHRAASIMGYFGLDSLKEKILNDYSNYIQQKQATTA